MNFLKYPSLEKLGNTEVEGILNGMCYVFPKIDGTNASLWFTDSLQAGSRNRQLTINNDNANFYKEMLENKNIVNFFNKYKDLRLYGEWLVPHSLKTYHSEAWNKFYIFDVLNGNRFLPYEEYKILLDEFNLDYIPPLFCCNKPTEKILFDSLESNTYLIKDGEGYGEGVVIKNYDFVNRFGRVNFAKIVTSEFKAKHTKEMGVREVKVTSNIESKIASNFVTLALVEKTIAKIQNDNGGWSSKDIPRLLQTVYYDVIREEMWNILKKYKTPCIDFGILNREIINEIRRLKPNIF